MSTTDTRTEHHDGSQDDRPTSALVIALAWLIVLIPLAYGLWQTLVKAGQLLGS